MNDVIRMNVLSPATFVSLILYFIFIYVSPRVTLSRNNFKIIAWALFFSREFSFILVTFRRRFNFSTRRLPFARFAVISVYHLHNGGIYPSTFPAYISYREAPSYSDSNTLLSSVWTTVMPNGTKRSSGSERMEKLNLPANAFRNVMNANNTETVKGTLPRYQALLSRSPVN